MKQAPDEGQKSSPRPPFSVLYVDDEEELVDFMASELELEGYHVHRAFNGNEAIAILNAQSIDVVISDARMPEADGFTLLQFAKGQNVKRPFILMLTGGDAAEEIEAFDLGAEALFSKPFEIDLVLQKVKDLLRPDALVRGLGPAASVMGKLELSFYSFAAASADQKINIGRGGMFIHVPGPLPILGQEIEFKVSFDDQNFSPLGGRAVCRWHRPEGQKLPRGAGYEFLGMDESSYRCLTSLLADYPSGAFIPKT